MAGRVNCTGPVKDKKTGLNRQCRKTASADQTPTLCHLCLRQLQRSSNPHIAAESDPHVAVDPDPDVAAELNLVKIECEKKIDFLYGKVEGAVAWGKLDNMKESLLISKAWQDWLTDMTQEKFTELLTTAQSILVENKKGLSAEPHRFRNIN